MRFRNYYKNILILQLFGLLASINNVYGHGRLLDPPSRSSAWRAGFKTPINYDDDSLYCGGFSIQWNQNNGKCGICGDPYNGPRDNEVPNGKYAKNLVITQTYREGDVIEAKVELTANHYGFFVFKICPATSISEEVSQQCLDNYPLEVLNSNGGHKYVVPTQSTGNFTARLKLPIGLTCSRCVFQWTYTAANNWGECDDGNSANGCGPQETFRACADVKIGAENDELSAVTVSLITETTNNFITNPTITPNIKECKAYGAWTGIQGMDEWCRTKCAANKCFKNVCICP